MAFYKKLQFDDTELIDTNQVDIAPDEIEDTVINTVDFDIAPDELEDTIVNTVDFDDLTPEEQINNNIAFDDTLEQIRSQPVDYEQIATDEIDQEILQEQEEQINEEEQEAIEEQLPEFSDNASAIQYAIDNNLVMVIDYIAQGQPGRKNKIRLKRESGVNLHRIIEPHYVFVAPTTGNAVVTTYDRSVRKIRSFIIDNITNYEFSGKEFRPRIRIIDKGVNSMNNFEKLQSVGNALEKHGSVKEANVITSYMQRLLNIKTAQYLSIQGYWLRNGRCWANCYRHKRTAETNKPVQEVWSEC